MSARDEAVEMIRRICPPHLSADEYGQILAEKFDAHRVEILAELADFFEQRRPSREEVDTDFQRGRRACVGWVVEELREKATAAAATATPASGPVIDELRRLVRAAAPLWGAPGRYCDADIDSEANRIYLAVRAEILAAERGDAQ